MKTAAGFLSLAALLAGATPAAAESIFAGATPQHAAVADFNGDGRPDVAVANAFDDSVTIHLQTLAGAFPVSQTLDVGFNPPPTFDPAFPNDEPRFLLATDVDRDGHEDLIVLCSGNILAHGGANTAFPSVQTLLNLGSGTFTKLPATQTVTTFTSELLPASMVVGEVTGDGYDDLIVANSRGTSLTIMRGNGAGRFVRHGDMSINPVSAGVRDVAAADLDGDGLLDLLAVEPGAFSVLRQTAPGVLSAPSTYGTATAPTGLFAVALADLDLDGTLDAALTDVDGALHFVHGIRVDGTFDSAQRLGGLGETTGIAIVDWDSDALPDVAIGDYAAGEIAVRLGTGGLVHLPGGPNPRRVIAADLNADGRRDLLSVNEGDFSNGPGSVDLTSHLNTSAASGPHDVTLESQAPIGSRFELSLRGPLCIAAGRPDRVWVLEPGRRALQETDLNASARDREVFTPELGGVTMTEDDEGYIVERFNARIHEWKEGDGITDTFAFTFDHGGAGFAGLAYDDGSGTFFVSVPARNLVVKVNDSGALLGQFTVDPAPWDIAWDDDRNVLLVANPGRSDIRAFSAAGTPNAAATVDFANLARFFQESGFAGVTHEPEDNRLYVLTTGGMLVQATTAGAILDSTTLSPMTDVRGFAFELEGGLVGDKAWFLGNDGHIAGLEFGAGDSEDLIPLWPAFAADPGFIPAGLSYDGVTERILVNDRDSARLAAFSGSGNFQGFETLAGALTGGRPPFASMAYDAAEGRAYIRDREGVSCEGTMFRVPLPRSANSDMGYRGEWIWTGMSNPGDAFLLSAGNPALAGPVSLLPAADVRGYSFQDASRPQRLVREANGALTLETYLINATTAATGWAEYQ